MSNKTGPIAGGLLAAAMTVVPMNFAAAQSCGCDLTLPAAPQMSEVVRTIQHRRIDEAGLDRADRSTISAAIAHFGSAANLQACVEGHTDPSQPRLYNDGLGAHRAVITSAETRRQGVPVAQVYNLSEHGRFGDNYLDSTTRRTEAWFGVSGSFNFNTGATTCAEAARAANPNVRIISGGQFVSPRQQANTDGQYREPVHQRYTPGS